MRGKQVYVGPERDFYHTKGWGGALLTGDLRSYAEERGGGQEGLSGKGGGHR